MNEQLTNAIRDYLPLMHSHSSEAQKARETLGKTVVDHRISRDSFVIAMAREIYGNKRQ